MKILVIDVGGSHIKVRATGHKKRMEIPSGPKMTAGKMVAAVQKLTAGWQYDAVTIGYLGLVLHGRIVSEPHNLGLGWVGFAFQKAFGFVRQGHYATDATMLATYPAAVISVESIGDLLRYDLVQLLKPDVLK
ncbi:MAG: hypothetical protein H0V54_03365 [Chthoniobacterales bacterium]|nr:hypothetical protein [Chthoniobacterales bacterium]